MQGGIMDVDNSGNIKCNIPFSIEILAIKELIKTNILILDIIKEIKTQIGNSDITFMEQIEPIENHLLKANRILKDN